MNELWLAGKYVSEKIEFDDDWQQGVKWAANIFIFISAIMISVSLEIAAQPYAFIGFFIAHILWVWAAIVIKDKPLIALNVFFLPMDLWAMWIRL